MAGNNKTEKIKNVVLVVLFLSAILLLYFSWGRGGIFESKKDTDFVSVPAADVLEPSSILVSQDGESFIRVNGVSGYTAAAVNVISEFMASGNISAESIEKEEYLRAKSDYSLSLVFDYYLPFGVFCEAYGLAKPSASDNIGIFTELTYSKGNTGNLYIYSKSEELYYKLGGSYEAGILSSINDLIDTAISEAAKGEEHFITCYSISEMLGEGSTNGLLIPLDFKTQIVPLEYESDFTAQDRNTITGFAKYFFGEGFDFVRKIEEKSGTVTFMYGYGEKTLIADAAGVFEYKRTDGRQENIKYSQALDTALKFIASHGGFNTASGIPLDAYIKTVSQNQDGLNGFRFEFGIRNESGNIYYNSGAPLVVDVAGSDVTYFRRDFIACKEVDADKRNAYSAVNMLAKNYKTISAIIDEKNGAVPKERQLSEVADLITAVEFGVLRTEEELVPCWIVSVNNIRVAFDLFSADMLLYSLK